MESFILELGIGFSFVARQKRITLDGDDFYLDLLFFHRQLRRLVAVELKPDKFRPEHKGQMELYLHWLDKYERQAGKDTPIGMILCANYSIRSEIVHSGQSKLSMKERSLFYRLQWMCRRVILEEIKLLEEDLKTKNT